MRLCLSVRAEQLLCNVGLLGPSPFRLLLWAEVSSIPLTLLTVALQHKMLLTYVLAVLLSSKLLAVVSIVARASFSVAVSSPAVLGFG